MRILGAVVGVFGGLSVLVTAGCAGGVQPGVSTSSSAPPPASGTATPTATPTSAGPTPTPPVPAPTTTAGTVPAACTSAGLAVSLGEPRPAAGSSRRAITFRNTGDRPCVLHGYPAVAYVSATGAPVGPAARWDGEGGSAVPVAPGAVATAELTLAQTANFDPAVCRRTSVRGVRVSPPGQSTGQIVDMSGQYGCAGDTGEAAQLRVSAVRPA